MKENRNAIYVTLILLCISFLLSVAITYYDSVRILFLYPDFVVNCLLGIFTGSFLSLVIATINYSVIKKAELTEYANFINCLNISIIPIYSLFKDGKRNIDYEIEIILNVYQLLVTNLHMRPSRFYFFIPKRKLEKKIDETLVLTFDLYKKVLNLKLLIDKYQFKCISFLELDSEIMGFFIHLRNFDGDKLYTNVLTQKHNELLKLAHLGYTFDGKLNL